MKFGGTSVEDTAAFRNVNAIVKVASASRPVVVVSAISGFTNSLLQSIEQATDGDARAATKSLEKGFDRHLTIAKDLLGREAQAAFVSTLADARREIRQLLKIVASYPVTSPPLQDEIVALWRAAFFAVAGGGVARKWLAGAVRRCARVRQD